MKIPNNFTFVLFSFFNRFAKSKREIITKIRRRIKTIINIKKKKKISLFHSFSLSRV